MGRLYGHELPENGKATLIDHASLSRPQWYCFGAGVRDLRYSACVFFMVPCPYYEVDMYRRQLYRSNRDGVDGA